MRAIVAPGNAVAVLRAILTHLPLAGENAGVIGMAAAGLPAALRHPRHWPHGS